MILGFIKYIPLVLLAFLFVVGCSDSKERLKGERFRILESSSRLKPDGQAQGTTVVLPPASPISQWPQMDAGPSHKTPHGRLSSWKGAVAWKRSIGGTTSQGFLLVPPVVSEGQVYALDGTGLVTALDASTGEKKWSYRLETSTKEGCLGGGLAVDQGSVFISFSSADVVALNAENGSKRWQTNIIHPIRSPVTVKDRQLYVVTKNNKIVSLDVKTGSILWQREGAEGNCSFVGGGSPSVDRRVVIAPFSSGEVLALKSENGHPLWTEALSTPKVTRSLAILSQIKASPVIDKDLVFVTSPNSRFMALEFRTGRVAWDKPIGSFSTPAVSGGFIFLVSTKNEVLCLTRDKGHIVWITQLPRFQDLKTKKGAIRMGGPLLMNGLLFITSSVGEMYVLDAKTGKLDHAFDNFYPSSLPPVAAHEYLYILEDTGTLVALH